MTEVAIQNDMRRLRKSAVKDNNPNLPLYNREHDLY